jgi:PAS domain S-box-containing protein
MGENEGLSFLAGGGVAGQAARAVDWSRTPLGPPQAWPQSLKTMVGVMLQSRHPMFLWWGPELVQLYNDGYLPRFGDGKHPAAMGQRAPECWHEIWPIISSQIDDVVNGRGSSWNEDQLVPFRRNGRLEEVYWSHGYSPVPDDDGRVGGVLAVCTETTRRVIAERRARTIHVLAERTALAPDPEALLAEVASVLDAAAADVPFALLYCKNHCTGRLRLAHVVGLEAVERADLVVRARLGAAAFDDRRPHHEVLRADDAIPGRPWPEACPGLYSVPFGATGGCSNGTLVFGLSPRLPFDRCYRLHLEQIAGQIGLAQARMLAMRIRLMAENERNNLLMQAPVGTALVTGPNHVYQLANPSYCRMVGRTNLVGRAHLDVFPELRGTGSGELLDDVYWSGEPFATEERHARLDRRGDGAIEDCYLKYNLQPLRDPAGDVYGIMAIAVDITEQVKARHGLERSQREREELLRELEEAGQAKDEFLAMLGHELRNPLSPIATALQLMRLRGDTRTEREQRIIERQVNHLTRLVDDLLDVSRITRGKVELRRELVDVADVVAKAVEMSSDLFERANHRLFLDVPRERLWTDGDPVRLAQAVANLLTNAARYTDAGGKVWCSAREEGGQIVIGVKDNGVGMPPELLPRVFDLFVQGQRPPDRAQGGLGLGLTLVKNLVGLHGGTVSARSEGLGKGSEFIIRLASATPAGRSLPPPAEALFPGHCPGGMRVLVVDDNIDAADSLAELLRSAGHQVAVAYDPVAALAMVDAFRPEVALLDIGLPVMDGYQLAARLRLDDATAHCRLIALTGYGQPPDRARSESSGFEHHLVKPVDVNELMDLVSASVDRTATDAVMH